MINRWLKIGRGKHASDLHVTVGLPPMLRVTGKLMAIDEPVLQGADIEKCISQIVNVEQMDELLRGNDVDCTFVSSEGYRNRVNIYRQRGFYAIAIRLLNETIPSLESLDMPPLLADLCRLERGLILVTGPTGSGKSTTLAAMIDRINQNRQCHILTLEDPIEYVHNHKNSIVNQREIGRDSKAFHLALRSALREDPDVILVGEMRDHETISLALTAAETGHLVLSTLHTTSAATTIDRIIDVFPANQQDQIRTQLATTLKATIAQRLLPRSDRSGRCAVLEIMLTNDAIGNMIRKGKTFQIGNVMQTSAQSGMQTIDMALARSVQAGRISYETALEQSVDDELLRRLLGLNYG